MSDEEQRAKSKAGMTLTKENRSAWKKTSTITLCFPVCE
jgi:hypothetical protein